MIPARVDGGVSRLRVPQAASDNTMFKHNLKSTCTHFFLLLYPHILALMGIEDILFIFWANLRISYRFKYAGTREYLNLLGRFQVCANIHLKHWNDWQGIQILFSIQRCHLRWHSQESHHVRHHSQQSVDSVWQILEAASDPDDFQSESDFVWGSSAIFGDKQCLFACACLFT